MTDTRDVVSRLRELHALATPGPWVSSDVPLEDGDQLPSVFAVGPQGEGDTVMADCFVHAEAELIAAMRNALPALLDVVEAARGLAVADRLWHEAEPHSMAEQTAAVDMETAHDDLRRALEALRKEEP